MKITFILILFCAVLFTACSSNQQPITAVTQADTAFEEGYFTFGKCNGVLREDITLPAGTKVVVLRLQPEGFYGNWAEVQVMVDSTEKTGYVDSDNLENWSRNLIPVDHCATP